MKRRELYGNILMIAIAALIVVWVSFAWTSMTGLTFAGSRNYDSGRNATKADHTRARTMAVLVTVIAGPVALWAVNQRRRQ